MNNYALLLPETPLLPLSDSVPTSVIRAAVVDPYSTGAHLASAFARRGIETVAVLAVPPPPERAGQLHTDQYAEVIAYGDDTEQLVWRLKQLRVKYVLAGTESGVMVADWLAHRLGVPGNHPATSIARRDKFAMALALENAGVARPRTLRAYSVGAARNAAYELGINNVPVVVKPPGSAGSDRVVIARDINEVSAAATDILNATNLFGTPNDAVLVQQYLAGEQYAVNTTSRNGVHRVVEVWHDRRTALDGGVMIYDRMDLLRPDDPRVSVLADYVSRCLDALGIAYGPAHTEVMLTTGGPVLIETGSRLQGGDSVALQREATGTSQTDAAVQAAIDSASVHAARARGLYPFAASVTQMFLQASRDGQIDEAAMKQLLEIPGVAGAISIPPPGAPVRRTVDLLSSPGTVYLIADSPEQVDSAYAAVRTLESTGLYQSQERPA